MRCNCGLGRVEFRALGASGSRKDGGDGYCQALSAQIRACPLRHSAPIGCGEAFKRPGDEAHIENASSLKPALVSIEDGWQIGYLLEQLENDWVAVFLPQAPTPMSGNIMYFPTNRVRSLGITMVQAMSIVKAIGVGSGAALRGVNLTLPSPDHRTTS